MTKKRQKQEQKEKPPFPVPKGTTIVSNSADRTTINKELQKVVDEDE